MSAISVIGFHTGKTQQRGDIPNLASNHNFINFFGYLPGLGGFIAATARRDIAKYNHDAPQFQTGFRTAYKVRGVIELVGLGSLFIVPDLAVSTGRAINAKIAARHRPESSHAS